MKNIYDTINNIIRFMYTYGIAVTLIIGFAAGVVVAQAYGVHEHDKEVYISFGSATIAILLGSILVKRTIGSKSR